MALQRKSSGIDHKTTSPYHPGTNGLTERFNKTLINCLNKHADTDQKHWHDWLPYTLLAYRTRIHSTTGQTPFALMFGREMNTFNNWKTPSNEDVEISLYNRALEIRKLMEHTVPETINTIEDKQKQQKKNQNKQHNVTTIDIPNGTIAVLIRLKKRQKVVTIN